MTSSAHCRHICCASVLRHHPWAREQDGACCRLAVPRSDIHFLAIIQTNRLEAAAYHTRSYIASACTLPQLCCVTNQQPSALGCLAPNSKDIHASDGYSLQVGGFQAAKYFTYVFMALAIAVVAFMSVLCGLHCLRRMRMRRELGAGDYRSGRTGRPHMPLVRHCSFSDCDHMNILTRSFDVLRAATYCYSIHDMFRHAPSLTLSRSDMYQAWDEKIMRSASVADGQRWVLV